MKQHNNFALCLHLCRVNGSSSIVYVIRNWEFFSAQAMIHGQSPQQKCDYGNGDMAKYGIVFIRQIVYNLKKFKLAEHRRFTVSSHVCEI